MNPLTINPLPLLAGAAIAALIGFGGGWAINGWRLAANVAETKQAGAEFRAKAANTALDQLAGRLETMNAGATAAQLDVKTLGVKMDQVRKELKNAQSQKPLAVDCRPDTGRLDRLRNAVNATNAAVSGTAAR